MRSATAIGERDSDREMKESLANRQNEKEHARAACDTTVERK